MGLSSGAIQRRVERGLLHCVHRGVYAVGHPQLSLRGRWLAAVLACGPGAVLSHRSAAALWDLATVPASRIEVSVARRVRGPARVVLHLSRALEADSASQAGIPVTTPNRTLVDLAAVVTARRLRRAVERAERLQLLDVAAIERLCTGGRHGTGMLRSILSQYDQSIVWTRSELERSFLELGASAGLPVPLVNVQVAGWEVDMLWCEERLVVELDGYAYHRTRAAFERDRRRDADLQLAGYRVL